MVENVACAVTVWCNDACMICGLWVGGFDQHRWGEEDARGGGAGRECGGGCKRKLTCVLNDEEVDVNAGGVAAAGDMYHFGGCFGGFTERLLVKW